MAHVSNPGCHLFIKFYWNAATPIYLYIVCDCFCATMAELNSCSYPKSLKYLLFRDESYKAWIRLLDNERPHREVSWRHTEMPTASSQYRDVPARARLPIQYGPLGDPS